MSKLAVIAIALALNVLTLAGGYALWYLLRGRRRKRRDGAGEAPDERKASHGGWGGYGKDSYCYPKINDMMGFEFVKVVRVPEELTIGPGTEDKTSPEKAKPTDRATGMRQVSVRAVGAGEDPQKLVTESPEDEGNTMRGIDAEGERIREQVEEVTRYEDLTQDIFDEIERNQSWANREYDDDGFSTEEIDHIIDGNAGRIEDNASDEESENILFQQHEIEEAIARKESNKKEKKIMQKEDPLAAIMKKMKEQNETGEEENGGDDDGDPDDGEYNEGEYNEGEDFSDSGAEEKEYEDSPYEDDPEIKVDL